MNEQQVILSIAGALFFLAFTILIVSVCKRKKGSAIHQGSSQEKQPDKDMTSQEEEEDNITKELPPGLAVNSGEQNTVWHTGIVHNIGKRNSQQDSYGLARYDRGVLAVVADGMGGLSDGDRVSRKIVDTMLGDVVHLADRDTNGMLFQMLAHTNQEVNRMLGNSRQYKSGSTLVAALVEKNDTLQWISVGDSRICLFRGRQLIQLNREHAYEAELLRQAVNCEISFGEIKNHPDRRSLSSFIGMGKLKQIDGSIRPLMLQPGDRILLMTDGVYNALSEQEIVNVLVQNTDALQAAAILEKSVLERQRPRQDNFTALILDV